MWNRKNMVFFLAVEGCLYASFLVWDLFGGRAGLSAKIKYAGILLCLIFLLCHICHNFFKARGRLSGGDPHRQSRRSGLPPKGLCKEKDLHLVTIGLAFTALADLFLLFGSVFWLGVASFILVQLVYFYRLSCLRGEQGSRMVKRLALRLLIFAALLAVVAATGLGSDGLLILSLFYAVQIGANTAGALQLAAKSDTWGRERIFGLGMALFLLCDINVAFFNMGRFLELTGGVAGMLVEAGALLMWAFYLPAQVLIVISAVVS